MTTHFLPKTGRILKTLLKFDCLLHISRFGLILKRLTPSMKNVIRKCIVVFSPLPPSLFLKLKHYSFQSPTFSNTLRVDAHVSTRAVHGRIKKLYFARRRPQRNVNSRSFNLPRSYSKSIAVKIVGELSWRWIPTSNIRGEGKDMYKKRTTRAKLLLALLNLLLFWPPLCRCKRILKKSTQGRTGMTRTTGTTVTTRLTGMTKMTGMPGMTTEGEIGGPSIFFWMEYGGP